MSREQIGTVAGVPVFAGNETLPKPPPDKPTDADVEALRRAMVEAWLTRTALGSAIAVADDNDKWATAALETLNAARGDLVEAAKAWDAAKRARGGL